MQIEKRIRGAVHVKRGNVQNEEYIESLWRDWSSTYRSYYDLYALLIFFIYILSTIYFVVRFHPSINSINKIIIRIIGWEGRTGKISGRKKEEKTRREMGRRQKPESG